MQRRDTIFFFYETAVGLGHQRRASGIANSMAAQGFDVSVGSGTFVSPEDFFDPRIDLIKLPAARRHKEDGEHYFYDENNNLVHDPDHDPKEWTQQRLAAIDPYARAKRIDVLMVEWWPFQRRKEFSKIVERIVELQQEIYGHKPMIVSSVRDVLTKFSNPEGEAAYEAEMQAVRIINKMVDHLLVHSDPALISLSETFSRTNLLEKPVHYTGYVVHGGIEALPVEQRDKTVLVSCGSGDSGHHLMKAAAQARPFSKLRDFKWIYVLGPRMEADQSADFHSVLNRFNNHAGQPLNTEVHPYMSDLPLQMGRAGLSLSYAGYNSTLEVTKSRAPAVLVPKMARKDDATLMGDFDNYDKEQWRRLVRLQERGIASIAHPDLVRDPQGFAALIDHAYDLGTPQSSLDLDGAANTARIMSGLLKSLRGVMAMPEATMESLVSLPAYGQIHTVLPRAVKPSLGIALETSPEGMHNGIRNMGGEVTPSHATPRPTI